MSGDPHDWLLQHRAPGGLTERAMAAARAPREPRLRHLALAACVLLGAGTVLGWQAHSWSEGPASSEVQSRPAVVVAAGDEVTVPVRFVIHAPDATSVTVVGTFNGWDADATPLLPIDGGLFHLTLPLPRGRHEYMFLVDGDWVVDPAAPLATPDEFGHRNGVLDV